jgi:CarD family transcriptional regulator
MRDLYRCPEQTEPSYSERTLYETTVETLVREVAAAHGHAHTEAQKLIEQRRANVPRLKEAKAAAGMDRKEDEGEAA